MISPTTPEGPRSVRSRLASLGWFLIGVQTLDFNRAVLGQRVDRADRRKRRREHGAHDTDSQRELRDRPALVLDHYSSHVALVDEISDGVDHVAAFDLDGFPEC